MTPLELKRIARVRSLTSSGAARAIRTAAGLSLGEIGRSIDASPSTIFRWEAGQRSPRGDKALAYDNLLQELLQAR